MGKKGKGKKAAKKGKARGGGGGGGGGGGEEGGGAEGILVANDDEYAEMEKLAREGAKGNNFAAVGIKHGSVVVLSRPGSGNVGPTRHAIYTPPPPSSKKVLENLVAAFDVTLKPQKKSPFVTTMGEGGMPEGYPVLKGNAKYMQQLVKDEKVVLAWLKNSVFNYEAVMNEINELHCNPAEGEDGLFVAKFARGALSTAKDKDRLLRLLKNSVNSKIFKSIVAGIEEKFYIHHCFMVANLSGSHAFHGDALQNGADYRLIITGGSQGKTMWWREEK